jgi:hypothetical protein
MSGRTLRTLSFGVAFAAALVVTVPVTTEAAELGTSGSAPSLLSSGWDVLAGFWEKVGAAIGSLWGDAGQDAARTDSSWDKSGGGIDPNGPPGGGLGGATMTTACGLDPSACGTPVLEQ